MVSHTHDTGRQEAARTHLRLSANNLQLAKWDRWQYAQLARQYGLSYAAIGDELQMTEAGVRRLLRSPEPAKSLAATG